MATVAPPPRNDISGTAPNPSNAVARAGFGSLWDYVTNLLGVVGSPTTACTALGAYQKTSILGTVSQSGGVPTGAIIERGSNANGQYVRFADGTLICTCFLTINTSVAAGASVIPGWSPPDTFVGTYSLSADVIFYTAASAGGNAVYGAAFGYSTGIFLNTGRDSSALAPSFTIGATNALSYTYRAIAVGRWV